MKRFKSLLIFGLILFCSTSILAPNTAVPHQKEGDIRLFYDKMIVTRVTADGTPAGYIRRTHCKLEGNNCIIGPTITALRE